MYKKIIFAVGFMLPISVIAAELMPLNDSEISGGASCMIVNTKGKFLIDERVKIDGTLFDLKKQAVTTKTKTWLGDDLKITFTLSKGKMLEDKQGGFSVGTSPIGKLVFNYKGVQGTLKAREQCFGSD